MGCDDTTVGLPFGVVAAVSSSGVFLPMTAWRSTDGVDECRSMQVACPDHAER